MASPTNPDLTADDESSPIPGLRLICTDDAFRLIVLRLDGDSKRALQLTCRAAWRAVSRDLYRTCEGIQLEPNALLPDTKNRADYARLVHHVRLYLGAGTPVFPNIVAYREAYPNIQSLHVAAGKANNYLVVTFPADRSAPPIQHTQYTLPTAGGKIRPSLIMDGCVERSVIVLADFGARVRDWEPAREAKGMADHIFGVIDGVPAHISRWTILQLMALSVDLKALTAACAERETGGSASEWGGSNEDRESARQDQPRVLCLGAQLRTTAEDVVALLRTVGGALEHLVSVVGSSCSQSSTRTSSSSSLTKSAGTKLHLPTSAEEPGTSAAGRQTGADLCEAQEALDDEVIELLRAAVGTGYELCGVEAVERARKESHILDGSRPS